MIKVYSRVENPHMRKWLLESLHDLSDRELQLKEWVSPDFAHSFWDTLRFDINVIYNDLELDENPEDKLGYVLVDQDECDVMGPLIKAIDDVYDIIGPRQPDEAYTQSPLWEEVIRTASDALKVFVANEEKVKAKNPRYWQDEDNWDQVPI